jgi:hypothetical protein
MLSNKKDRRLKRVLNYLYCIEALLLLLALMVTL